MREAEVSGFGVISAAVLSLIATIGTFFTSGRSINHYDWLWITMFAASLLVLSGAVVNYDLKRLIK